MSFAIGPFTQQAIKSRPCTQVVAKVNSTLPVANYVPDTSNFYRIAAGEWEVEVDMKGTMINGLTNPQGNDTAVIASCPTGNCTFPDYGTGVTHASIGMCSKCIDTTSLISPPNDVGNISLPDGTTINFGSDAPWLTVRMSNLSYAQSMFSADFAEAAPSALANISILSVSQSTCTNSSSGLTCPHDWSNNTYAGTADAVATSCTIYPCLRSYFGSVTSGILDERVVSTKPAPFNFFETNESYSYIIYNYTALRSPCVLDGAVYTDTNVSNAPHTADRRFVTINIDGRNITAPDECLYKLYGVYGQALQAFMYTLFNGRCNYNARQGGELWCPNWWWLSPLYSERNASFASLSRQIDDFATAITNKFRSTGSGNYVPRAIDALAVVAQGQVFETTVCTYLDWRWLLLPGGLVIASALLLVWMVMRNYGEPGQPVWKGNVLPLLFFGLRNGIGGPGPQTQASQPRLMELDEIQDLARTMIVKYHTGPQPGFDVGPGDDGGQVRRDRDIDMDSLLGDR
ncbi:hypothetical protein UCRPA7_6220 [Phaeoacremonium minimum UCRPA7]|uniref:Uncharacterized protein n=1 Tax=Phaeoacremonium minimum (strain UCR-PA7) TaxID=1286976 RepID=R8BG72_PHAM7|nr:hypothetical protein UCRPA7_6220 [Phaeoacremonium minimum UCRPA7]EON98295.1 hypothetical protein UCRPA7_6220 [Phaeoacremonium minimum UCRPA7]